MTKLIRSSEFGDWLMREIAATRRKSAGTATGDASARLESLQITKQVLREFLATQERMLSAADAARKDT